MPKRWKQAYDQYLKDLELIRLVAPSSPTWEEISKNGGGYNAIMDALDKRRKKELEDKKGAIQKYVERNYSNPQERKKMYDWLYSVAEALSAEEAVRQKKLWRNSSNLEAKTPKLSEEQKKILAQWRKTWLEKANFGDNAYKDEEINGADKDIILATFAFDETVFSANKMFCKYYSCISPNVQYKFAPIRGHVAPEENMETDDEGIRFHANLYATSAESQECLQIKCGYHSAVGFGLPYVGQAPLHEKGHVFVNAVAASLFNLLPFENEGRNVLRAKGGVPLFQTYVSRKLRQMILNKAAEKLGWTPGSGVLATEPDKAVEGISAYGMKNPADFIAEVYAHAISTEPEERNALGQALMEVFSGGPRELSVTFCAKLHSGAWANEFSDYVEYFNMGHTGDEKIETLDQLKQLHPKAAENLESILQSKRIKSDKRRKIQEAVFSQVSSILNNAISEKSMRKEMDELSQSLYNLRIVIDNKCYNKTLKEEKKVLKKNPFNAGEVYQASIGKYAILNVLDKLKPENIEQKLPDISKLEGIKKLNSAKKVEPQRQGMKAPLESLEDDKLIPRSPSEIARKQAARTFVRK